MVHNRRIWFAPIFIAACLSVFITLMGETAVRADAVTVMPTGTQTVVITQTAQAVASQESVPSAQGQSTQPNIAGGEAVSQDQFDNVDTKTGATVGVFVSFRKSDGGIVKLFCTGWRPLLKNGTLANGVFTDRHCFWDPTGGIPGVVVSAGENSTLSYESTCVVSGELDITNADGDDPAHCKPIDSAEGAPNGDDLTFLHMSAENLTTPTALRVCQVYPAVGRKVQLAGWGDGWVFPQSNLRWISIASGHQEVIPSSQCLHSSNPSHPGEEICTKDTVGDWRTRNGDSGAPMIIDDNGLCAAGWYISGHSEPYSWAGSFTQQTLWLQDLGIIEKPVLTTSIFLPLVTKQMAAAANSSGQMQLE